MVNLLQGKTESIKQADNSEGKDGFELLESLSRQYGL